MASIVYPCKGMLSCNEVLPPLTIGQADQPVGGIEKKVFLKKSQGQPDHDRHGDIVLLEIGPDKSEGPGNMTLDGERGQLHLGGDLGMTQTAHPAEQERPVQLRRKMIHRLLQNILQFFEFHCLIRFGGAFLEIADQIVFVAEVQHLFLQLIADKIQCHRTQKTLKMMDGTQLLPLDPQTRKNFLGEVLRLFGILGQLDTKGINLPGVCSENLPEGRDITL